MIKFYASVALNVGATIWLLSFCHHVHVKAAPATSLENELLKAETEVIESVMGQGGGTVTPLAGPGKSTAIPLAPEASPKAGTNPLTEVEKEIIEVAGNPAQLATVAGPAAVVGAPAVTAAGPAALATAAAPGVVAAAPGAIGAAAVPGAIGTAAGPAALATAAAPGVVAAAPGAIGAAAVPGAIGAAAVPGAIGAAAVPGAIGAAAVPGAIGTAAGTAELATVAGPALAAGLAAAPIPGANPVSNPTKKTAPRPVKSPASSVTDPGPEMSDVTKLLSAPTAPALAQVATPSGQAPVSSETEKAMIDAVTGMVSSGTTPPVGNAPGAKASAPNAAVAASQPGLNAEAEAAIAAIATTAAAGTPATSSGAPLAVPTIDTVPAPLENTVPATAPEKAGKPPKNSHGTTTHANHVKAASHDPGHVKGHGHPKPPPNADKPHGGTHTPKATHADKPTGHKKPPKHALHGHAHNRDDAEHSTIHLT